MALMQCGLPFSVVQPAAYMQNLVQALKNGELTQPYRVDALLSWVDAEDVGEAVALLMTKPNQGGGTYELCGTDVPLTTRDIAETLSQSLQQHIDARACPVEDFVQYPPYNGFSTVQLDRLEAYFRFIEAFGMRAGNPNVLTLILGRAPTSFSAVAERLVGRV
jgi:nucleoside-diphosphate-sugar epimerase